jgi:predicted nucleotide-binding protein
MIVINDSMFYSPYLLAKTKRMSRRLALLAPVVRVGRKNNLSTFQHIDDHFRYLWDLDTTMVCEDATRYEPNAPSTLEKIRPPTQVTYERKAERIKDLQLKQKGASDPDEIVQKWLFKMRRLLDRFSTNTKPTPNIETVFIACSWHDGDDGKPKPNRYAQELLKWLNQDFGIKRTKPLIKIIILKAVVGESLATQIYSRLREATQAIVLLTADIESEDAEHLTKPNVIHELGYLMRHLDSGKLMILRQEAANVPSNVRHDVREEFQSGKLSLTYRNIILWLHRNSELVNKRAAKQALESHIIRLDNLILGGSVRQKEGEDAKRKLRLSINELS